MLPPSNLNHHPTFRTQPTLHAYTHTHITHIYTHVDINMWTTGFTLICGCKINPTIVTNNAGQSTYSVIRLPGCPYCAAFCKCSPFTPKSNTPDPWFDYRLLNARCELCYPPPKTYRKKQGTTPPKASETPKRKRSKVERVLSKLGITKAKK
jgi:hypothetical protein